VFFRRYCRALPPVGASLRLRRNFRYPLLPYAVDGHYHKAACFDPKREASDGTLRATATGHFFRMDMRTHHLSCLTMAEDRVTYTYLTNDFTLPAYQIVLLYKHRWHQLRAHPGHPADPTIHPVGQGSPLSRGSLG